MVKKKKCKVCGRPFVGTGDYCSEICKTTGVFVGGGGDTTKPNSTIKVEKTKPQKIGITEEQKEKVQAVYQLPIEERWNKIKVMLPEERAYAKRVAYKMLKEEQLIESLSDWDVGESSDGEEETSEDIGDSDDGSI